MPIDSVRDSASLLDEHTLYSLSCRSSTVINEPRFFSSEDAEKIKDLAWYQELPITEFTEVSLRRLSRKGGGDFLVLVLRDQSICCFGPDDGGLGDSLSSPSPPDGKSNPSGVTSYPSSYLLELDRTSLTLIKLSFSHQPRDLMELVQIQHCVQANLAEKPGVSDLIYWVVLLLFARTFCDWVNDVTKLVRWHEVVDATFYDPAAIADTNTSRSQPKRQSISALPQTAGSRPRIHGRIRAALLTQWELVKNIMARTCVLSSLAHNISSTLSSSIGAAEEASAIRSATIAAHAAARSAARAAATQASHDAAWESSIDAAWFEDDIVGRAGLAYIADHLLSERGLPRSEHAEAMCLIKEGASGYTSPGWMVGCSAG
ncbi:hypothetical protein FRC12_022024, partial [Ceratobasidium sp. 428]